MNVPWKALLLGAALRSLSVHAQTSASGILLSDIRTIFGFGDSYSATGYTPALGVNNFPGYGNTASGGYVWLQYLSQLGTNGDIALYDLAASGAVVNNSISTPLSLIPAFTDQVDTWSDYFGQPMGQAIVTSQASWEANSTLFAVWFGINDAGSASGSGNSVSPQLSGIFDSYNRSVAQLYAGGARNFLILGVPPMELAPSVAQAGDPTTSLYGDNADAFNEALSNFVNTFPTVFPEARIALFDTQPFFSTIVASPETYGFMDSTTDCVAYSLITNQPDLTLPVCEWPMSQYVWWNSYHPTWAVHRLLATVISQVLSPPTTTSAAPSGPSTTSGTESVVPSTVIPTTSLSSEPPASSTSGSTSFSGSGQATGSVAPTQSAGSSPTSGAIRAGGRTDGAVAALAAGIALAVGGAGGWALVAL